MALPCSTAVGRAGQHEVQVDGVERTALVVGADQLAARQLQWMREHGRDMAVARVGVAEDHAAVEKRQGGHGWVALCKRTKRPEPRNRRTKNRLCGSRCRTKSR